MTVLAVPGRPLGRGRPRGPVHAVPHSDTTRTAVCGARVGGAQHAVPLPAQASGHGPAGTCPDCAALLALHVG